jgi:hypothetical protein
LLELESFFLFPSVVAALDAVHLMRRSRTDLRGARTPCAEAVAADGVLLVLDDRGEAPRSVLLALGACSAPRRRRAKDAPLGDRPRDEPRESHHFACLLGYGPTRSARGSLETLAAARPLTSSAATGLLRAKHAPLRSAIEGGV